MEKNAMDTIQIQFPFEWWLLWLIDGNTMDMFFWAKNGYHYGLVDANTMDMGEQMVISMVN